MELRLPAVRPGEGVWIVAAHRQSMATQSEHQTWFRQLCCGL